MPKRKKEKSNTGRPRKVDNKVLLDIVNQYYFVECRNQPEMMNQHGIYTALAEYAHKLGVAEVKEYDFRRNTAVRERMKELREKTGQRQKPEITGIAYMPLNMTTVANMSKEELVELLRVRDGYYETVCQSAASVVVREKSIVEENRVLKDSVTRLEKETEILHQRIQSLETAYQKAAETAKRYKKIIKDNVTPERAKALLDSALRPGVIKDENLEEMRKIGMQPLARAKVVAAAPEFDPVALFGGTPDGEQ